MSARAAASKTAEALRTIGEVAELLGVQTHVLRFWEGRFPQIRPIKGTGGRRYYRPSDIALMRSIRWLLHDEGMTIRGVQKLLRERGVRHVAGLADGAAEGVPLAVPPVRQAEVHKLVVAAAPAERASSGPRQSRPRPQRMDAEQLALPGFPNDAPPPAASSAARPTPVAAPPAAGAQVANLSAVIGRLQSLRDRMANA